MAVFRFEKTKDYTVMANFHLRDTTLSLKAKGLLSLMLSLPDNWDYTTKGLSSICKDGVDSICATVKELEKAGYVIRRRLRDAQGRMTDVEYTIMEKPVPPVPSPEEPKPEKPVLEASAEEAPKSGNPFLANPQPENPVLDKPQQETPQPEKPAQLNTNQFITKKSNTDLSNTHSFFPSQEPSEKEEPAKRTDRMKDAADIRAQIEYDILAEQFSREQLDELVEIMVEVAMNRSPTIRIGRDAEYPTAYVQQRFDKINALHIEKVIDGIRENKTRVYNTKAYLMASLFNSVSTIDHHYSMLYNAENNLPGPL